MILDPIVKGSVRLPEDTIIFDHRLVRVPVKPASTTIGYGAIEVHRPTRVLIYGSQILSERNALRHHAEILKWSDGGETPSWHIPVELGEQIEGVKFLSDANEAVFPVEDPHRQIAAVNAVEVPFDALIQRDVVH